MSRRFQFSLRTLFVAMLAVACFFGGIRFERELERRRQKVLYSSDLGIPWPQGSIDIVDGQLIVTYPDGDPKSGKSGTQD
jgi:hypothetical protein